MAAGWRELVTTTLAQTLTSKTLTSPVLNTGVTGTAVLDENDMATDSDTQLATQQSIKAYVDAQDHTGNIGDLDDTVITSVANKHILVYDDDGGGSDDKWKNVLLSGDVSITNAGVASLKDHNDTRSNLGLAIGSDVQAYNDSLAYLAGLTITNEATFKTTTNLEIGVDVQAYHATLAAVVGSTYTGDDAIVTVGALASGSLAAGFTDVPIAQGGTGSSTASAARTALGLQIGVDVQAYDADLAAYAGITAADSTFIVGSGSSAGDWEAQTGNVARTSLGLGTGNTPQFTGITLTSTTGFEFAADGVVKAADVTAGTGKYMKLKGGSAKTGDNLAGGATYIEGGDSTGTAVGGNIIFQTTPSTQPSGGNSNSPVTALTIRYDKKATFAGEVAISGNLTVSGSTTTVNTEEINLADNVINLNSNAANGNTKPGDGVDAGLTIERGNWVNTQVFWDESDMCWKMVADKAADTTVGNSGAIEQTIIGAQLSSSTGVTASALTHIGAGLINTADSKFFIYM